MAEIKSSKYVSNRPVQEIDEDAINNAQIAAISYLPPLSLVCILARKDSRFVRYHAKQGFVLMCFGIIFWYMPSFIKVLGEIIVFAGILYGFYQANANRYCKIPIVYQILFWRMHLRRKNSEKQ